MPYKKIINEIYRDINACNFSGEVASYIPELANVDPEKYGISFLSIDNEEYNLGNFDEKFSVQSIFKVFSLSLAFSIVGEKIWGRVGVEQSGNPFNSMVQLEYENGKPRNPFINAGALVIADILISNLKNPKKEFLEFVRKISGNNSVNYNKKTAISEKKTGYVNTALVNLMKAYGNIENNIEEVLDFYFCQCSLEMTCKELAMSFFTYTDLSKSFNFNNFTLNKSQVKRINALMLSCGFYDESGEFSFKVGLPGKSGVGGGIVAIHPQKYSVAVWSPKLNKKGNSVVGMKTLELLTTKTE
ncbi:MAG: glutaminase, partial [Bacteroidales bacterium]|nr:glutaminase [Bacteroidales bacterium]